MKVKVLEVELDRKRIALTMRMDEQPAVKGAGGAGKETARSSGSGANQNRPAKAAKAAETPNAAMGDAFAQAFAKMKK